MSCHQEDCEYKCYKFSNVCQEYAKKGVGESMFHMHQSQSYVEGKESVRAIIKERFSNFKSAECSVFETPTTTKLALKIQIFNLIQIMTIFMKQKK